MSARPRLERCPPTRRSWRFHKLAPNCHLWVWDRNDDAATLAFELSQRLTEGLGTRDYAAERAILGVMLETARLKSGNFEFCLRKPLDLLQNANLVPLNGAMGI